MSAGELDKTRFPNAQVIVKGNLVGVVAPTEWEAIRAAQQVAAATKWTDWKGLPGNANLFTHLRDKSDWTKPRASRRATKPEATSARAMAGAAKKLSATYEIPFMKHAPHRTHHGLGRCSSGRDRAHLHAQPKPAGAARRNRADARHDASINDRRAHLLRPRPLRKIERRQRRRGRRSGDSCRRPLASPCACSGCGPRISSGPRNRPPRCSDVEIGLDANGKMIAYQVDHYMPAMQDDRPSRRGARRSADHGGSQRERRVHRLDGERYFRSLGLRRRVDSDGTRPRHISGRPESLAARHRPARSQHAHAGTVPAEFPARAGRQRGGGAGRRGRHPVPHRSRHRRARDRRAQGGSRRVGMGDAPVAASPMRYPPATRRCAAGAFR